MRRLSRRWTVTAAAAVAAAGLSVLATSAVVGAQSSTEVIHACADARGVLRMIPADGTCQAAETPVSWNAQGVQGVQGPPGAPGATGARGKIGKAGKIKLNLSGDVGTQLILGRLKALDKKVVGIQAKLKDTHDGVLFLKGYLKVHHRDGATCKEVETVYREMQREHYGPDIATLGLGCN